MPFGTPGGDVQQQAMLQVLLNITAHGMAPQQAVEAPRIATRSFPDSFWPHAHAPGLLEAEKRVSAETVAALAGLGHRMADWPEWDWRAGAVCCVVAGADGALQPADLRRRRPPAHPAPRARVGVVRMLSYGEKYLRSAAAAVARSAVNSSVSAALARKRTAVLNTADAACDSN